MDSLNIGKNAAKKLMKKHNVEHDGSPEMVYSLHEAENVISKEKERIEREQKRRKQISERRNSPHNSRDYEKRASSRVDSEKTTTYSIKEVQYKLGINRYDLQDAIRAGLIASPQNKRYEKTVVDSLDIKLFKECLTWERLFNLKQASNYLNISVDNFYSLTKTYAITPKVIESHDNPQEELLMYRYGDFIHLEDTNELKEMISTKLDLEYKENIEKYVFLTEVEIKEDNLNSLVNVGLRDRTEKPFRASLHLGPTNSGKTYRSLERLKEAYELDPTGKYVYAGPLRMLAFEVYEKLVAIYGASEVGFLTGEEQINPEAPILAATIEMAPTEGDLLVMDESHWMSETDRGHHWTRLLLGGKYRYLEVIAAGEAKEAILPLISDAVNLEVHEYERRTKIKYHGKINASRIPTRSAVVCFSRKNVFDVAKHLIKRGVKAGVLYGKLPLETRKKQIQDFLDNKYDVIVTTDVIGHGINLPIDNVVFAETEKFDGNIRRDLHSWEAGQIAGRAGRFGLSDEGKVYILNDIEWLHPDEDIVKEAVLVASGQVTSDLDATHPLTAPRFSDLMLSESDHCYISKAIDIWRGKAELALKEWNISPSPLTAVQENLNTAADILNCSLYPTLSNKYNDWVIPIDSLWQLVSGPFDKESPILKAGIQWINDGRKKDSLAIVECFKENIGNFVHSDDLEALEYAARSLSELKMLHVMFNDEGMLGAFNIEEYDYLDRELAHRISEKVSYESLRKLVFAMQTV